MAEFAPPTFANLGKSFADLQKKKFDFDNIVKIVNKTDFGLTLTTQGIFGKTDIAGKVKGEYKDKSFGEAEGEVDTKSGKVWGKGVFNKLVQNVKLTAQGGFDPASKDPLVKESWSVKAEAEYRYGNKSTTTASVLVGESNNATAAVIEVAEVIGFEGVSVGGQVKLRPDQAEPLQDYNVGAQWEKKNFTAALTSEYQGDVIRASWYHTVNATLVLGAEIISDEYDRLAKPEDPRRRVLNFVSQYQIDVDTLAKLRANQYGEVGAVIEHRLANPKVLIGAAAQYKLKGTSSFVADKFGLSVSLGDF
jgi:hypothetical protein